MRQLRAVLSLGAADGRVGAAVPRAQDPPDVLERFHATLDLVDAVARQVSRGLGQHVDVEELVSYGHEGLLHAARRYDPTRGVPFRAFANYRVRGAIMDGVRALSRLPRRTHRMIAAWEAARRTSEGALEDAYAPLPPGAGAAQAERAIAEHLAGMASAMAVGMVTHDAHGGDGEPTTGSRADDPEAAMAQAELLAVVVEAIGSLRHPESDLLRRHYLGGERFDHVAEELGLSKSWASRLHTRAIRRLSERLRGAATEPD